MFLAPCLDRIQDEMKTRAFPRTAVLPGAEGQGARGVVRALESLRVEAYLNEQEMKEYRIED